MGKVDEMRRMREERVAQQERLQAERARSGVSRAAPVSSTETSEPAPPKSAAAPAPEPKSQPSPPAPAKRRGRAKEESVEGRCTGCGKDRPLVNGLVANHQKGFGKMCPGARKKPL